MSRFARVQDGSVREIISLPSGFEIDQVYHPDIVAQCIACGEAVQEGWRWDGEGFVPALADDQDLDELKGLLKAGIDAQAEVERLRYITPGAGQAMTYAQKAEEARRCLDASASEAEDYPLLAAEIGITASTLIGVAQVVATANAQWLQIGAAIEAARLSTKKAISEAETIEQARTAASAIVWPYS